MPNPTVTPYQEALSWIEKNWGSGGANSLAKLLLSLWNSECSFSYRECIDNLDDTLAHLAVRVIKHFSDHGEDEELVRVGYRVHELYPRLWDVGQAMREARATLRRQWEREQEEAMRADPDRRANVKDPFPYLHTNEEANRNDDADDHE